MSRHAGLPTPNTVQTPPAPCRVRVRVRVSRARAGPAMSLARGLVHPTPLTHRHAFGLPVNSSVGLCCQRCKGFKLPPWCAAAVPPRCPWAALAGTHPSNPARPHAKDAAGSSPGLCCRPIAGCRPESQIAPEGFVAPPRHGNNGHRGQADRVPGSDRLGSQEAAGRDQGKRGTREGRALRALCRTRPGLEHSHASPRPWARAGGRHAAGPGGGPHQDRGDGAVVGRAGGWRCAGAVAAGLRVGWWGVAAGAPVSLLLCSKHTARPLHCHAATRTPTPWTASTLRVGGCAGQRLAPTKDQRSHSGQGDISPADTCVNGRLPAPSCLSFEVTAD